MEIFFDTSVLVAASERGHPHHAQARPALARALAGEDRGFICVHSFAEVYAALTRLPIQPRIHPVEAARIVNDNLAPHLHAVPLEKEDYVAAVNLVATGGWAGAKIYDALLLRCAEKCSVDRIYTFNLADFRQLAPEGLQGKVCAP